MDRSFLGKGWSFPPAFEKRDHSIKMVSEDEDIRQSLHLLLSTIPGERLMHPTYGCDLHSQVFQQIGASTISTIIDLIATAILYFEPRITVDDINVNVDREKEGYIDFNIVYTIREINVRSNIVYPFYFIEGTDVRQ